jgi:hypothetical protein
MRYTCALRRPMMGTITIMTEPPVLSGIKVELRFDISGGLADCLPLGHAVMKERFGLAPCEYMLNRYEMDNDDQDARVLTYLIGAGK